MELVVISIFIISAVFMGIYWGKKNIGKIV